MSKSKRAAAGATRQYLLENLTNKVAAGKQQIKLNKGSQSSLFRLHSRATRRSGGPTDSAHNRSTAFRARSLVNGRVTDEKTTRTGLRTLELRRQRDAAGQSFMFVINGVPVFAKGGNWIPADSFPTRITKEKYRYLIKSVRDSNMNMLRVWGGGIYEADEFYELCDEMGILVWQDFMFACSMYPANQEFLDNVRAEAIDNVKRLRNHPSIVLWAGNNEVETAWFNWGWRQSLPASVWDDYLKIFHGVLQEVSCAVRSVESLTGPAHRTADSTTIRDSIRSGDVHFWRVWHASEAVHAIMKNRRRDS